MHGLGWKDGNRQIDWGRTSADYSEHRPNYPRSFYDRLAALGVGLPGQHILDLGTGTGFLALEFARRGASVTGVDIATGQIEQARRDADRQGLPVRFECAPAEETKLPDKSFEVITASQCWPYFDRTRMISEVRRLLRPLGVLVTSHFCWVPRECEIARRSEELVQQFNSEWTGADWDGFVPPIPKWATTDFDLTAMFVYDEPIRFTREQWRGRMRACRGVAATLNESEVQQFDRELGALLENIAPHEFEIVHRIDAHFLHPKC